MKWCIWSEEHKKSLMERGIAGDRLVVTGNPAYDNLFSCEYDKSKIRTCAGIGEDYEKVITWAPSALWPSYRCGENYNEKIFAELQRLCRKFASVMFVFKPHPSELVRAFHRLADRSLKNLIITEADRNATELFYISDIIMSWNSSVITEAVVLQKPIIGLNFHALPEKAPCVSEGVALPARNPAELEKAIGRIFSNEGNILEIMSHARAGYIEKYLYKADGMASSRIADTLEDLIKNPPSKMSA